MKKANTQRKNNLNMFEHTTPFEARLALFLESFKGTGHLSVDDIKDIVWNAHDNNLLSRIHKQNFFFNLFFFNSSLEIKTY